MEVVYKYQLDPAIKSIEMPQCSQLLAVQVQNEVPQLWALVNKSLPMVRRRIQILGTGWDIAPAIPRVYIGTFQIGFTVWHVFDLGESA
jgi:hypothetical protein